MSALPALFVSHGPPTLILDTVPAAAFLRGLGADLDAAHGRPRAILCVSAHWETPAFAVSSAPAPATIHDFYGFPEALYRLRYAAPGAPSLAAAVVDAAHASGLAMVSDGERGLDHGAWAPLMMMYPHADIPVVSLSVRADGDPEAHLALGRALAHLRRDRVLVVASGNATHNLAERGPRDAPPAPWAAAFADWLATSVADTRKLAGWTVEAPHARRNHPTPEHFTPLLVAAGAGSRTGGGAQVLHQSFLYRTLAMDAFAFA